MRFLLTAGLCWLFLSLVLAPANAQNIEPSRPFSHIVADWNATFERVEKYLQGPNFAAVRTKANRAALLEVSAGARNAKESASAQLADAQGLLAALGPAPKEGEAAESQDVLERRNQYNEDVAFYRARAQQADLALARAAQLDARLAALSTRKLLDHLLSPQPSPFYGATLSAAVGDTGRLLRAIAESPADWWAGLPEAQRTFGKGTQVFFLVGVVVLLAWGGRRYLLRRLGKDPSVEQPSYTRRLVSGISEGVARGIVPALFFAGIMVRSVSDASYISGLFGEVLFAFCLAMIVFFVTTALVRAVLSPDMPVWQLTPLDPVHAVTISRNVTMLAAVSAVDIFFRFLFDDLSPNAAFRSLYSVVFGTAEGALLISLCRRHLWHPPEVAAEAGAEVTEEDTATPYADRMWQVVRLVIIALVVVSIGASLAGYGRLGDYLNESLGASLIIAATLYLFRGLLRELVGVGMRSPLLRDRLAVSHASRSVAKFWLRVFVDAGFIGIGMILVALVWGISKDELWRWVHAGVTGFSLGSIRISLLDIVIALTIFVGLLLVTRVIQRVLSDRVLPQTQLEPGIQHSVAAGFGYVGMVLAATLGITALGIDLSNLAIIAGALSVGIGFGLQNIVNNFVSGLILLIERPIKVGDWVVVGGNEGMVRRISVRATEIQTFQRASVIVPNAEFLSNALTNWTHKDRNGRIEIAVGVAYGSDIKKVEEILLRIANAHEEVMALPEPFVIFMNFGNSSLDFELRCYTENVVRRLRIASALRFSIDAAFREEGIEIPFPQHVVHMAPPAGPEPS